MKRRGYIFTNKKHGLPAIMSVILGGMSLLSIAYLVVRSYLLRGEVPGRFGWAGALTFLYSLAGLCIALFSLKAKDRYLLFPVLGIILNGISLLGLAVMLNLVA